MVSVADRGLLGGGGWRFRLKGCSRSRFPFAGGFPACFGGSGVGRSSRGGVVEQLAEVVARGDEPPFLSGGLFASEQDLFAAVDGVDLTEDRFDDGFASRVASPPGFGT